MNAVTRWIWLEMPERYSGIDQARLSRYENGKADLPIVVKALLAHLYGEDLADLDVDAADEWAYIESLASQASGSES